MKPLPLAVVLLFASAATAQPPAPKPPTLAELNTRAVDVLRAMHDHGRELYNAGDATGTVRVYQTALSTVSAFVPHHPAVQKAIATGLAEAEKTDGDKAKAFKLHEVIEQVRADLRAETKKLADAAKTPDPVQPKDPNPKPKDPNPTPKTALAGVLTLDGQPLAGAEVTVVSLTLPAPRVFTVKTDDKGAYSFAALPPAEYVAVVTPPLAAKIPVKYATTDSSGLSVKVAPGGSVADLNLQSK